MLERRFGQLPTEQANPASRNLDTRSASEIVRIINREDAKVPPAVARAAPQIVRAVDMIVRSLSAGGRLVFAGAGTSGRLGVIEAAECPPTFSTPPAMIKAVMAGGRGAVFRSREGAEDDAGEGARRVGAAIRRGDIVVGIAASGITPFVKGAFAAARRRGCATVLVTSNTRRHGQKVDITIAVGVGPEVLSGSTRMKSATAAKLVLNTLTTASMVRLGKVYDNWMVDLKPSSEKLRQRGLRILCGLGRVRPARAQKLLSESRGSVKTAILMARGGIKAPEARRRLRESDGSLRAALGEVL